MKEYLSTNKKQRKEIINKIQQTLFKERGVIFAYVYGSFLNSPCFRDVDIGVYLRNVKKKLISDFEIELTQKISKNCDLPFDIIEVRVINFAPYSFINNIIRTGELLFSHDNTKLSALIERVSLKAIANEYLSRQSLKELLPA